MKRSIILGISLTLLLFDAGSSLGNSSPNTNFTDSIPSQESGFPLGKPGLIFTYTLTDDGPVPGSVVKKFTLSFGPVEEREDERFQWLRLRTEKADGEYFTVWILTQEYPPADLEEAEAKIARYILREGEGESLEFRHPFTGEAVLPALGAWKYLFPRSETGNFPNSEAPTQAFYLGKEYQRSDVAEHSEVTPPAAVTRVELLSDALIGVPGNTRPKDDRRRYDDTDYEYVRLTREDYDEMIGAGMNCFRVEPEQIAWLEKRNVYYWGIGGKDIQYPEYLYRSNYLSPLFYMDEPAVGTRDYVIRPRLEKDLEFRHAIDPRICYDEFRKHFADARNRVISGDMLHQLKSRPDVDVGNMEFRQQNIYSWDTFASSALYQLSEDIDGPPYAFVFEPPGRFGTRRTLPEMNMAYQCQIPVDDPKNLIDIIYGFLRGGARITGKEWGTSIYGAVDRADSYWYLTHAYDNGARLFFFWDTYRLACVPYRECLSLARHLRGHIESHPHRNLKQLKQTGEVAVLLPAGYNLGHVHMGKGNLWGLEVLNLERKNRLGIPYRKVMSNFFVEIERCLRLGVAFDLFWDLDSVPISGYRELVRIKEDGSVAVVTDGQRIVYDGARIPPRPEGTPPRISLDLSPAGGEAPLAVTARAVLEEGSSPVYYTTGTGADGVYRNQKIFWELYGPDEKDYRVLNRGNPIPATPEDSNPTTLVNQFLLEKPGVYRLRASTCDLAGRTAVAWKEVAVQGSKTP